MQQDLTLPSDQSASRSDVPLSKLQVLKGRGQLEVEVLHNELQRQGWGQSSRCRLDSPIEWRSKMLCDVIPEFIEVETGKGADALDRRPQLAASPASAALICQRTKAALAAAKARGQGRRQSSPSRRPRHSPRRQQGRGGRAYRHRCASHCEAQAAGAKSLRQIAGALNARGIATARGGRWEAQTVRNILRRDADVSNLDALRD